MTDDELPIVAGRSIDHPLPSRDSEVREAIEAIPVGPDRTIWEYRQHVLDTLAILNRSSEAAPTGDDK